MNRIDQVNEMLRQRLAKIINEEARLENGLITISYVDCSPDLKNAKVAVSVLPDNLAGTALEKLRKNNRQITNILSKKIKLRKLPRLNWSFDSTEKNVASLDEIFNKIEKEREEK